MQFRCRAQRFVRIAGKPRDGRCTCSQHHGQQADDEHSPVWHVQLPREPHGDSGHGGGIGGTDPHALYSSHCCALDARLSHGNDRWNASAAKLIEIDVQLGWGHSNLGTRTDDGNGPLNSMSIQMQYIFSLTPRMLVIAVTCLIALCLLLFLAGIEIGQKMAGQTMMPNAKDIPKAIPGVKPPKIPKVKDLAATLAPTKP